jgi:hypothetical protein
MNAEPSTRWSALNRWSWRGWASDLDEDDDDLLEEEEEEE